MIKYAVIPHVTYNIASLIRYCIINIHCIMLVIIHEIRGVAVDVVSRILTLSG
jgi:hypothetical protein